MHCRAVLGRQPPQGFIQCAVLRLGKRNAVIERCVVPPPCHAPVAFQAVERHPQQPCLFVLLAVENRSFTHGLEKDLLKNIVRVVTAARLRIRQSVYHVAVDADELFGCFCGHAPSSFHR